jgi:iron(III) transport system permease protein
MTTEAPTIQPQMSLQSRRRLLFAAIFIVEALLLIFIATKLVQIEDSKITGDPVLLVLVIAGTVLPVLSAPLRREPLLLVLFQVSVGGLIGFALWPLALVFVEGFKAGQGEGFSLIQFEELLRTPSVVRATRHTMTLGIITAALTTFFGLIIAYALTLTDIPLKRWLRTLIVLPLVSPPFAVSFAFILLFGRRGVITYDVFGIRDWDIYGAHGIVMVQFISDLPVAILILSAVFAALDRDLEDAADDLGGKPLRIIRTITFPLVLPAIMTAALLNFIASIADFGNPMLIGGGYQTLATQAFIQFIELYNLQLGAALSMLLIIPALAAFLLQHWIVNRRSYVTVTGKATTGYERKLPHYLKWPLFGLCFFLAAFNILLYGSIFVGALVETWGFDFSFTLRHVEGLENAIPQLRNSIIVSVAAGVGGGFIGVILAWLVTRPRLPWAGALDFSATLMYAIPGTVVGIGYIVAFNAAPLFWGGTYILIIVAFTFRRLPLGLRTGIAAQKQLDPTLEEASLDLGASRMRTFWRISFPLLNRAFLAGVIFIFIRSMTDLSSAVFLNGARTQLFTTRMFREMVTGTPSDAAAFAAALIVIILIALGILSRLTGKSFVDLFRL